MPGWTWAARHGRPAPNGSASRSTRSCSARPDPVVPANDPFYEPPAGFEHARPGTVLRSRDVELAFLGLVPQQFTATQLLYRTTDLNGMPQATATTVMVPTERAADGPCPIVSYQCAIDAVAGRCFPSYALRRGAKAVGALAQFEFLLVAAALAEGWAVSVPDHEGTTGMWGAPLRTRLPRPRRRARRAAITSGSACRRGRRSACGATPAAGWPAHGPPR